MIGPGDPKKRDGQSHPLDPWPFGWIDRLILTCIVPKDRREEFIGDLLEEWSKIRMRLGEVRAREWVQSQVRRSIIQWLSLRLVRAMRTVLGMLVGLLLFVYLLPGILVGLLLYGIGVVVWSFVDALRRANPADCRPPRGIARFILNLVVPGRWRDEFIDDLREEYELKIIKVGPRAAQAWLWEQVCRSISPWLLWRLARMSEFGRSEQFAAWAVQIAVLVYLLPAFIVVAFVTVVGITVLWFVDLTRRPPGSTALRKALHFIRSVAEAIRRYFHRGFGRIGGDSYWAWGNQDSPEAGWHSMGRRRAIHHAWALRGHRRANRWVDRVLP
jgi:hypothetical protein